MKIPRPIESLIESFQKLPGIGPKTAARLVFYLLHVPDNDLVTFSENLVNLKKDTIFCEICKNVDEVTPCSICSDMNRDRSKILVVESPLDVLVFERTRQYRGLYHVLHGRISPLDNIGPEEIYLNELFSRLKNGDSGVGEVIIATNPTMEGDATAMYITKKIKASGNIEVTRLGMGIPTGADLEYADDVTLTRALEGRREI